jgi:hypothetical protein
MARSAAATLAALVPCLAVACASAPRPRAVVPLVTAAVGAVETYGPGLVATDDSGETLIFTLEASASISIVRVWPSNRLEPLYPMRSRDSTYFQSGTHTVRVRAPVTWTSRPAAAPEPQPAGSQAALETEARRCFWDELRREQQATAPPPPAAGDTSARRRQLPVRQQGGAVDLAAIEDRCRRAVGLTASPSPGSRAPESGPGGEYYIVMVASDAAMDAKHLGLKIAAVDITASDIVSVLQVLPGFLAGARAHTWAGYAARVGGK